jgi:hypothetical protein
MVRSIEVLDGFAKPHRGVNSPIAGIAAARAGFFHDMEKHLIGPHVKRHRITAEK